MVRAGSQSGHSREKTGDEHWDGKQRALKVGLKSWRYYQMMVELPKGLSKGVE